MNVFTLRKNRSLGFTVLEEVQTLLIVKYLQDVNTFFVFGLLMTSGVTLLLNL